MSEYVAFLRGINVGGHTIVPMHDLRKTFATLRFRNVRTLLASGNVLFEAAPAGSAPNRRKIEERLMETFGRQIDVFIRTTAGLRRLVASQPFQGIPVTPQTKFYVTLLSEKPSDLEEPYKSRDGLLRIFRASSREVCSVVTPAPASRSVDLMKILEEQFGRKITTRNWQTILRILKATSHSDK